MTHISDYLQNGAFASALIPTRGRPGLLVASVRLLLALADDPDRVEILLRVDDDDPIDYEALWPKFSAKGAPPVTGRVLRGPRKGYANLYECFNDLAEASTGKWLLLWNDDALMSTPSWDNLLDRIPNEIAVAHTLSNHGRSPCTFPFFTRTYYETLGHVALQTHNDTWIEEVSKGAGIDVDVPILVLHAMCDDTTAEEGKAAGRIEKSSAEFYTPTMTALRAADIAKLRGRR